MTDEDKMQVVNAADVPKLTRRGRTTGFYEMAYERLKTLPDDQALVIDRDGRERANVYQSFYRLAAKDNQKIIVSIRQDKVYLQKVKQDGGDTQT